MFKVWLPLFIAFPALAEIEMADIGFPKSDKHIAIELTTLNGEDALKFRLASNVTDKSIEISKCAYLERSLRDQVDQIQNPEVQADFKWIFIRSDYSKSLIEVFYPEFKALLERADPKCRVRDLQRLIDLVDKKSG